MLHKRFIVILCAALFFLIAFYLWDNILILDDSHPSYLETTQIEGSPLKDPSESQKDAKEDKTPVRKGYHIHINLDQLMLYVYKNDQLLKTYPVSGGKPTTPSPLGTWRIVNKDKWGEGFGGSWMGFNVPWGKYGIHGTVYPWFIGKSNSSKGCIRMKNKDVAELYKMVPHGTTVTISHTNRVFRVLKSGDIGSDVLEVQKNLKELGYFHGYPNGVFGSSLSNSIRKFQKDNKIRVNGKVTNQTYSLILEKQKQRSEQKKKEQEKLQQKIQAPPELPPQENKTGE
ncbi:MAG: L,D-transpeptidase family protein [Clostridia bacterium]|nr:L,D-transpeptidase family protein [Clostridia bacterium]